MYDVTRYASYVSIDSVSETGTQIGYNAVYSTSGKPGGSPYPNDVWQKDPQFIDVTNNDFHLRSISPLIDAGINLTKVMNDCDGVSRPKGPRFDIGAFEFAETNQQITTTAKPPPMAVRLEQAMPLKGCQESG